MCFLILVPRLKYFAVFASQNIDENWDIDDNFDAPAAEDVDDFAFRRALDKLKIERGQTVSDVDIKIEFNSVETATNDGRALSDEKKCLDITNGIIVRTFNCPIPPSECNDDISIQILERFKEHFEKKLEESLEMMKNKYVTNNPESLKKWTETKEFADSMVIKFNNPDENVKFECNDMKDKCDHEYLGFSGNNWILATCCKTCSSDASFREVTDYPEESEFPEEANVKVRYLSSSYWTASTPKISVWGGGCGVFFNPASTEIMGGDKWDANSMTTFRLKKQLPHYGDNVLMDHIRELNEGNDFTAKYKQLLQNYLSIFTMNKDGRVDILFCREYLNFYKDAEDFEVLESLGFDRDRNGYFWELCKDESKQLSRENLLSYVNTGVKEYGYNELIIAPTSSDVEGFFLSGNGLSSSEEMWKCKDNVHRVQQMASEFNSRYKKSVKALMCKDRICSEVIEADEKNCPQHI